ncbi:hypothetical protein Agub_g1804, partial [Astrephomene gubernaculifera]
YIQRPTSGPSPSQACHRTSVHLVKKRNVHIDQCSKSCLPVPTMSWRSQGRGASAWRQRLAPLRQEAASKGFVARSSMSSVLEELKAVEAEAQDQELAEDLPFLVQQLLGPPPSVGAAQGGNANRDTTAQVALCRLLASVATSRPLRLHPSAANLILAALRQWADVAPPMQPASPAATATSPSPGLPANTAPSSASSTVDPAPSTAFTATTTTTIVTESSLHTEALAALAVLLPEHLGALPHHERVAQLAALQSLLVPHQHQHQQHQHQHQQQQTSQQPSQQQQSQSQSQHQVRPADALESQCLALTALAACFSRSSPQSTSSTTSSSSAPSNTTPSTTSTSLTPD